MAERMCPKCGRGILSRCGRKGLWEKYVLPLFGVFPWRCSRCRTRFRMSDRGAEFKRMAVKPDFYDEASGEQAQTADSNPQGQTADHAVSNAAKDAGQG